MSTFLNIDIGKKIPKKFIWKHILFSVIWLAGILILVFRIDIYVLNKLGESGKWLIGILPILYLCILGLVFISQRWYSIISIFYPVLAIFWFVPKIILDKGKFYLFVHYLNYLFDKIKNYKQTIIHSILFFGIVILLIITDNELVKIFSILIISYFYLIFIIDYVRQSFKPAQLFGSNIEEGLESFIVNGRENKSILIENFAIQKNDEKLPEHERKVTQLTRLIMANYTLDFLSNNLNSFKGKRAYIMSWTFQFLVFLIISIFFFSFINYQLFIIDPSNFIIAGNSSFFEFFYYTMKTITFSDIDSIKPISVTAKIVEIASFFVLGIFLLIIVASTIFSLRQDKINENIQLTTEICSDQNRIIESYIKEEYGTDIQTAMRGISTIGKSIENLKNTINKIF